MSDKIQCLIIGPGMITETEILPAIYQLQRIGVISEIKIVGTRATSIKALADNPTLKTAFPSQSFTGYPDHKKSAGSGKTSVRKAASQPDLYKEVLAALPPRQLVVVALPDQIHFEVIKEVLKHDQHVLTVKPFVLKYEQSVELEKMARERGLLVGIEYHKRLDDRALMARRRYLMGQFGDFRVGQAHLVEKYYYMRSNFQNWCTCENSDAFTYIGCHFVDLTAFITGLKPTGVTVHSKAEPWPNGNLGYLWTSAQVDWENGATLNLLNGFGYPEEGAGGNTQGIVLHTAGKDAAGLISHSDQFRGVKHSILKKGTSPGNTAYMEPNPDFFQMIDKGGEGLTPVGYGYRTIENITKQALRINQETEGLDEKKALAKRKEIVTAIDREGIVATPANSSYNVLVSEAGRLSITNNGRPVTIEYGKNPRVKFKEF